MYTEKEIQAPNGIVTLVVLFFVQIATAGLIFLMYKMGAAAVIISVLLFVLVFICWFGFFMVNPNEAQVLQLFGKYVGTVKNPGLR